MPRTRPQGVFLLSIGNELLDGRTLNSNAQWFGEELRVAGVPVAEVRAVGDEPDRIRHALREASRYPLVVVTGGLGPTNDDRTAEAAAREFRRPLTITPESLRHVKERYAARKLPLTTSRKRLARVPRGAALVENPSGTAPGFWIKLVRSQICFLPGVPTECRPMFLASVLPKAQELFQKRRTHSAFWRTFGWGESKLYQEIAPQVEKLEKKYPHTFYFGVHITFPCIDLSLETWEEAGRKSPSEREVAALVAHVEKVTTDILVTRERKTIPDVVFQILRAHRLTLSAAESCTGGLVGKTFTDFSGSSSVFVGGAVSYANAAKEALLGVRKQTLENHGAVSQSTVEEMAQGIKQKLGTDYALAISGISGPDGGTPDKPVGTVYVAILGPHRMKTLHQVILNGKGSRDQNRVIAMNLALDALRLMILEDLG